MTEMYLEGRTADGVAVEVLLGVAARPIAINDANGQGVIVPTSATLMGWNIALGQKATTSVGQEDSAAFAAAAAGNLTLTNFTSVASIRVDPAGAWPAGVNQVTVTNLQGGAQVYDLPAGTAQPLVIAFNPPLGVIGLVVISVPAIVGGPAYTISAEGTVPVSGAIGQGGQFRIFSGNGPTGLMVAHVNLATGDYDTQWLGPTGIRMRRGIYVEWTMTHLDGAIWIVD